MSSDHLRITLEFLSGGPLKQRALLLYSPSTVGTLKEELVYAHGVESHEIMVYVNGSLLEDKVRVIDKGLYHIRLPQPLPGKWAGPLGEDLGQGIVAVEKGVTFEEGVYVDSMIEVDTAPIALHAPIYIAFAFTDTIRLFDTTHGIILSPMPLARLGYCILYADWERLRFMTMDIPTDPTTWLYDRLRRDYGIRATSSVFGLHTAPLAELRRYHGAVEEWTTRSSTIEDTNESLEGYGEDGEDGESESEDLEEIGESWQGVELEDSEMWR